MIRTRKIFLILWIILTLTLTLTPAPHIAQAQEYPYYVSGHIFYALENLDEGHTQEKFRRPIGASFDDSFGLELRAGMILSECWFAEAMLEYAFPFKDKADEKKTKTEVLYIGGNLKGIMWFLGSIEPYILIGTGLMGSRERISYKNESSTDIDWALGLRLGLGADVYLTETIALSLENSYVIGTGRTSQIRYLTFTLGLSYHF